MNPESLSIPFVTNGPSDKPGSGQKSWVNRQFPFYQLLRILNFYLDVEFWIISLEDKDRWFEIHRHRRDSWPMVLDYLYGKVEERANYSRLQIQRMEEEKKRFCSSCGEISTLFVPILKKGNLLGILQSGVFHKKEPTREMLLRQWKNLTGSDKPDFHPAFSHYARTMLECPLVEGPVYQALQEILELYAGFLSGEGDPDFICQRVAELKIQVIARHLPHSHWLDILIKNNRFYPPTWRAGKMRQWEMEEMGLDRLPTTVLAVRIQDPNSHSSDDLDILLQNHRFQNELLKFSRTLPNLAASPLQDYGLLFFTSPDPGRNAAQAKAEIQDRIGVIAHWASRYLQVKIFCGVGWISQPGGNLSEAFRQAMAALESGRQLKKTPFFYEEAGGHPPTADPLDFFRLSKDLCGGYTSGNTVEMERARHRYIGAILDQREGRPEIIRLHFQYALGQIVEAYRRRLSAHEKELQSLQKSFGEELWGMEAVADLVIAFQEALKRLAALTLKPAQVSKTVRMEGARRFINENFSQALKLEEVARENGFSVSVFGRAFKRDFGMGFSAYLRKIRLEQAKKLLISTRLPISQVIQECGFNNQQYFFELFKRSTGYTPQAFRGSFDR